MAPQNENKHQAVTKDSLAANVTKVTEDLIQVDDKVYNAKGLAEFHPGGELFVRAFGGKDATEAFLSYHRREFPHSRVAEYLVGEAPRTKDLNADKDYLELCKLVEAVLPSRTASFAPFSYYLKVSVLLSVALGLETYIHYNAKYVWYLTAPLGFLMALIGLNIQHDANHGSISKNPYVNRFLGITQNWIGGSALSWIHQHVVQHHINTNDIHNDPDIEGNPILRLNPMKPVFKVHLFQHIYVFVLLALFGFTFVYDSFMNVVRAFHFIPFSKLINKYRPFEIAMAVVLVLRWLVLPLVQKPSVFTLLNIAPMFMVGGYYLSFFFVISHNFADVKMIDKTSKDASKSFLYNQVVSSSNVGGSWLCFLNGGLNYQIEHHLFPRIQHTHYPKIAPIVREFCLKKKIPYVHFPTVYDNFVACRKHLWQLGNEEQKSKAQ